MSRDRIIQVIALTVMLLATVGSGALLPRIIEKSDRYALRYTDISVEDAPIVALGTAIGALRGIIVDALWIKVHMMKEKGLFYEVMGDAELITKLQPRFAAVWAFHGHNMAYNISVATHTEEERWEWVNAGIHLVRDQGLRYNPNNLQLHRELAFWFAHKIEGYSDDAHLFYKTRFCQEWHYLLGEPPDDYQERIEWIKAIADAPGTLVKADLETPGVTALLARIEGFFQESGKTLNLPEGLLHAYAEWELISRQSKTAEALGKAEEYRTMRPLFNAFDELAGDPQYAEAWKVLIRHLRKRALLDDYNMDPQRMYEYTRDLGPLDWRHAQAHALYWTRRGSEVAERRVANDDDIYKIMNNDRVQLQSMQALSRTGRIYYDPFSTDLPTRLPDPRWIDSIDDAFETMYVKHFDTRGGGGETFINFLQNYMGSAIREWYRSGHSDKAQAMLDRLDALFGTGQSDAMGQNPEYKLPLDVFVMKQTLEQYDFQPHIAPSDVAASLRYGYVSGLGNDDMELVAETQEFAKKVTDYFTEGNKYYTFENKFGRGRMKELVDRLEDSAVEVFAFVMIDRTVPLDVRRTIWSKADQVSPKLRGWTYSRIRPHLAQEVQRVYGDSVNVDQVIPPPANLAALEQEYAQWRARRAAASEAERGRDTIERQ